MRIGLFTEFEWRAGTDEASAFDDSLDLAVAVEDVGLDEVWLAEIHFQKGRSVLSSPLLVASAIAGRTKRIRIGTAVQVLPLAHPLRLAEDVATLDHLTKGRLDFGVGRSGLPNHYTGFNISFEESRGRFDETLEILRKAWTEERFSHEGQYFQFRDVCVIPKPFQKPHPPLRVAATGEETYEAVGRTGLPIFLAVRTSSITELKRYIGSYRHGRRDAGHAGPGDVAVIVPVHVADTVERARAETEASTMRFFRTVGEALLNGPRHQTGERLRRIAWEEVLQEFAVYGTPDVVVDRLLELRDALGYTTLSAWMNVGGQLPQERVLASLRLFAERVAPRL